MSRVVVVNFMSLDGVYQSVLSADEDRDGGFDQGGWVSRLVDESVAWVMQEATANARGMLLGRRTYEIFVTTWMHADQSEPAVAAMHRMPKYVASTTLRDGPWENTVVLGADVPKAVAALKEDDGADLVVFGSGHLLQALAEHDLVDEYRLLVFPVVLGRGKRLFPDGGVPIALTLVDSQRTGNGIVLATYRPSREE